MSAAARIISPAPETPEVLDTPGKSHRTPRRPVRGGIPKAGPEKVGPGKRQGQVKARPNIGNRPPPSEAALSPELRPLWRKIRDLPEGWRGEVIHGTLYVSPAPGGAHGGTVSNLLGLLTPAFRQGRGGPGGWIFKAPARLHLPGSGSLLEPDIAGWKIAGGIDVGGAWAAAYQSTMPDWVCEVLSPSNAKQDRELKMRLYFQAGIPHYWIVDPLHFTVEVYAAALNVPGPAPVSMSTVLPATAPPMLGKRRTAKSGATKQALSPGVSASAMAAASAVTAVPSVAAPVATAGGYRLIATAGSKDVVRLPPFDAVELELRWLWDVDPDQYP